MSKLEEKFDKAMKQGDIKRGGKTKEKLALAERKAMLARNDYIMTLAASNAFKQRYFGVEMPNVVDVLDQNFHDCLRQILLLYRQLCDQFGALIFGMLVGCVKSDRERFCMCVSLFVSLCVCVCV